MYQALVSEKLCSLFSMKNWEQTENIVMGLKFIVKASKAFMWDSCRSKTLPPMLFFDAVLHAFARPSMLMLPTLFNCQMSWPYQREVLLDISCSEKSREGFLNESIVFAKNKSDIYSGVINGFIDEISVVPRKVIYNYL